MSEQLKKSNNNVENVNNLPVNDNSMTILRVFAESQCARFQHIIGWLCIIIGALVVSNVAQFVLYQIERSQYETVAIEADLTTENGGNANFIGKDGDITNGNDQSQDDLSS